MQFSTSQQSSLLRTVFVEAAEVANYPDLLSRTHSGDVDLIVVQNLYRPEELAPLVERLESHELPFPTMALPPNKSGMLYGHVLDLAEDDLSGYFEDAIAFKESFRELFSSVTDFEERLRQVMTPMASGRQLEVLRSENGQEYLPISIRNLLPGGSIWLHCEDQKLVEPAKRRLHEVTTAHVSSFYMSLATAEVGGELVLYDLTWDQVQPHQLSHGRCDAEVIARECAAYAYVPQPGEMVIFGNGRVHEVRPVGPGRSRWTLGGFFAFGTDEKSVYYFS